MILWIETIYIYIYSSTHTFTIHIESNFNLETFRKFPLVRSNDFFPNPGTISRRAFLSTVFPFPLSPLSPVVHFRSWKLRVQRAIRFRLKKSIDAPPSVRSGIRREEEGEVPVTSSRKSDIGWRRGFLLLVSLPSLIIIIIIIIIPVRLVVQPFCRGVTGARWRNEVPL